MFQVHCTQNLILYTPFIIDWISVRSKICAKYRLSISVVTWWGLVPVWRLPLGSQPRSSARWSDVCWCPAANQHLALRIFSICFAEFSRRYFFLITVKHSIVKSVYKYFDLKCDNLEKKPSLEKNRAEFLK